MGGFDSGKGEMTAETERFVQQREDHKRYRSGRAVAIEPQAESASRVSSLEVRDGDANFLAAI